MEEILWVVCYSDFSHSDSVAVPVCICVCGSFGFWPQKCCVQTFFFC